MAVKWLPPSRFSLAKFSKFFITSSPVSKIRAKVFWPAFSCSKRLFMTHLPLAQHPPEQQPTSEETTADQCRLRKPAVGFAPLLRDRLAAVQRHLQHLRRVQRPPARGLFDLLLTAEAVGDQQRVVAGGAGRGQELLLADLHRHVVVLGLEAERAGHAAAAL